ncbi:hypothetical protein E2C01_013543 [Portunus trituberculatus]|uniref:Uncharacterized protein n=1 Tax=Portunus trituberculatus TaxID=210409 RepID=A0A5B7DGX4_PORTR|nr:hypothetical protein [Portunus trituberculatus]
MTALEMIKLNTPYPIVHTEVPVGWSSAALRVDKCGPRTNDSIDRLSPRNSCGLGIEERELTGCRGQALISFDVCNPSHPVDFPTLSSAKNSGVMTGHFHPYVGLSDLGIQELSVTVSQCGHEEKITSSVC